MTGKYASHSTFGCWYKRGSWLFVEQLFDQNDILLSVFANLFIEISQFLVFCCFDNWRIHFHSAV